MVKLKKKTIYKCAEFQQQYFSRLSFKKAVFYWKSKVFYFTDTHSSKEEDWSWWLHPRKSTHVQMVSRKVPLRWDLVFVTIGQLFTKHSLSQKQKLVYRDGPKFRIELSETETCSKLGFKLGVSADRTFLPGYLTWKMPRPQLPPFLKIYFSNVCEQRHAFEEYSVLQNSIKFMLPGYWQGLLVILYLYCMYFY